MAWTAIEEEPSDETLSRICEAHYARKTDGEKRFGVKFSDVHRHDAVNYTLSGTVEINGVEHGFIIDDGNWNGTVVRSWGDPEDVGIYDPGPPPEMRTFIPADDSMFFDRPGMFSVYLHWRKQNWFKDKERGYNYDRHFAPGESTEKHYREWAANKGMKVATSAAFQTKLEKPSSGMGYENARHRQPPPPRNLPPARRPIREIANTSQRAACPDRSAR